VYRWCNRFICYVACSVFGDADPDLRSRQDLPADGDADPNLRSREDLPSCGDANSDLRSRKDLPACREQITGAGYI